MSNHSSSGDHSGPNGDFLTGSTAEQPDDRKARAMRFRAIQAIALGWSLVTVSLVQFAIITAIGAQPTNFMTLFAVAAAVLGAIFIAWGRYLERRYRVRS